MLREIKPNVFTFDKGDPVKETVAPLVEAQEFFALISLKNLAFLQAVAIPPSVQHVGAFAFSWDMNIKGAYIRDLAAWCTVDFEGWDSSPIYRSNCLYVENQRIAGTLLIPPGVRRIGNYCFAGLHDITGVIIPRSVERVGGKAFADCAKLTEVIIQGAPVLEDHSIDLSHVNTVNMTEECYDKNPAWQESLDRIGVDFID